MLFLEISDARAGRCSTTPENQPCLLFTFTLVVVHKAQEGKSPSLALILHAVPDLKLINNSFQLKLCQQSYIAGTDNTIVEIQ